MIKVRPKYPTDLYDNIYIDTIQKAVVICLIIPTTFPFDAGSSVTSEKCIISEDPASIQIRIQHYVITFVKDLRQVSVISGHYVFPHQ